MQKIDARTLSPGLTLTLMLLRKGAAVLCQTLSVGRCHHIHDINRKHCWDARRFGLMTIRDLTFDTKQD